jgi:5-methylcytosine-specific restriction endonuclease McrA
MPRMDPVTGFKECNKCHTVYSDPFESFSVDLSRPDMLCYQCKNCQKGSYDNNPELQQRMRETHKDRYNNDPVYHSVHNTRTREWGKKEFRDNPEYRRLKIQYVYLRTKGLKSDGTITRESLKTLYKAWTGTCPFCGEKAEPERDHIIPVSKGGIDSIHNIQLMCGLCNRRKNDRDFEEWLATRNTP